MKKILALLLCGLMLVSIISCGKETEKETVPGGSSEDEAFTTADGATFNFEPIDSESIKITEYHGSYNAHGVEIPSSINGITVVAIGAQAFYNYSNITSVTIPETITAIDDYAFAGCTSLTTLVLPANVVTIGEGAFTGCSGLETITMGNKLETIGKYAFYKCSALKDLTLSTGLKTIGEAAFANCDALTALVLPEGVKTIEKMAFYRCHKLATLSVPASVEEIGSFAFRQEPEPDKKDEIETDENGESTYVELVITTVSGSYAEKYVNGTLEKETTGETTSETTAETTAETAADPA